MDNDLIKRLVWSGLLAGIGALASSPRRASPPWFTAGSSGKTRPSERRPPRADDRRADAGSRRSAPDGRRRQGDRGAGLRPRRRAGTGEAPAERPEILAGAAFAGGLVAALVLKRLTR